MSLKGISLEHLKLDGLQDLDKYVGHIDLEDSYSLIRELYRRWKWSQSNEQAARVRESSTDVLNEQLKHRECEFRSQLVNHELALLRIQVRNEVLEAANKLLTEAAELSKG